MILSHCFYLHLFQSLQKRLYTIVGCKGNGGLYEMIALHSSGTWLLFLLSFAKDTFGCFCAYTVKVGG